MAGPPTNRRGFLKSSAILGAGIAGAGTASVSAAPASSTRSPVQHPSEAQIRAEFGSPEPPATGEPEIRDPGSDFMVDLLRYANIDYVATMAGSSFRGLHESIVNYAGNESPQLITCVHEEISAAMAHGYAKVAGKPMACLLHSNVGLQHAVMAIYNAWCDRVPMMLLVANSLDAATRRPWVEWLHSQTDLAAMVRDFVKWDDIPVSLQHYAESFMRAVEITQTPPCEPVLLVVDADLQEHPIENRAALKIPKRAPMAAPAGDQASVDKAAAMLVAAETPVIVVDRVARTPAGLASMIELAELLQAPVIDRLGRLNFPTDHYLSHSFRPQALIPGADVIMGLEVADMFGLLNSMPDVPVRKARPVTREGAKIIAISANYGLTRGNIQDIQRYVPADLTIPADAEATLPQLIASVRRQISKSRRHEIAAREPALREAFKQARAAAAQEAAASWEASPIGTGRLCMEVWDQIRHHDWALVSSAWGASLWPQRLWTINRHYQYIGNEGGAGIGYGAPAAAGAALAHSKAGRLPVAIQSDGDLMMLPGTLWTLAHHRIPLLMVMQNNRAWHQETMHIQRMCNRRGRGVENATVGTVIRDPEIDFAAMARSMGVWAEGPIDKPDALGAAIGRAIDMVKSGRPALLDVITQPR